MVKVSTSIHESVKPGSYVSKAQLLAWEGLLLESVIVKRGSNVFEVRSKMILFGQSDQQVRCITRQDGYCH